MSTTSCSRTNVPAEKQTRRNGFTLIELLVVIAIIAILAAILFPVFARARENARRSSCQSNNKQIALGFIQYYQDYDERFPMNKGTDANGTHWANSSLQPYLKSRQILRCPSDSSPQWDKTTADESGNDQLASTKRVSSYGLNGLLLYNPDAADGKNGHYARIVTHHLAGVAAPSMVILLAEGPDVNNGDRNYFHSFHWGGSATSGTGCHTKNGHTTTGASSAGRFCTRQSDGTAVAEDIATERHLNGFNVAYLDGHVKWVKWEQVYKLSSDPDTSLASGDQRQIVGHFDPRHGA